MYRAAWHSVSFQSCALPTPMVEESTEAWGARQDRECGVQFAYMQAHLDPHRVIGPWLGSKNTRSCTTHWMLDISIQHKDFKEEERIVCLEKNSTTSDFIGEPQRSGKWIGWCWSTHPGITSRTGRLRKTRWIPFSTEPLSYIKLKTRYRWRRLGNQDFNVGPIGSDRFPCNKLGNHGCNRLKFCL